MKSKDEHMLQQPSPVCHNRSECLGPFNESFCARLQLKDVTWPELWQHMAQDCEAALVLRMALDDQNPAVIAAAAAALQALTGSRLLGSGPDLLDAGRRPAG